jgi:hypothetical protein
MRYLLTLLAALFLALSLQVPADAAPRSRAAISARRPGVFARLIELERRKNVWLRRTFLGR